MLRLQSVAVHRLDDIWIAPETFANANGIVAGLSQQMTRLGEYREVLFWLLLLGSWQFLASPGAKSAVVGASGALMFLLFAFRTERQGTTKCFRTHIAPGREEHRGQSAEPDGTRCERGCGPA